MLGAVLGDIIGSVYEWNNIKTTEFPLFDPKCRPTDDSVMSIAVSQGIIKAKREKRTDDEQIKAEIVKSMQLYGRRYIQAGYGRKFLAWIMSEEPEPYHSWGNGSAMRVSSVAWIADNLEEVLHLAKLSAEVSHDHEEGIKGAQAEAMAVYLARNKYKKEDIKTLIEMCFCYNLSFSLDEIRDAYTFDVSCQGSVPQAIVAFLESDSYEDAVRRAISIGGDSDTLAAMAGAIAEAYYGIPEEIEKQGMGYLDEFLTAGVKELQAFCRE